MRKAYLAVQLALAAVVVVFVARSMTHNWSEIRHAGAAITLDVRPLAVSAGIVLATYAMLISAWRAVLLGWGERLRYRDAARIWCLSNLARYVPGRIWQIAGMAALAERAGVSPWAAAGSAVVVQLLAIATGALVTGLTAAHPTRPLLVAGAGLAAATGTLVLAWRPATQLMTRALNATFGPGLRLEPVGTGPLMLSAAITTLAWLCYGLAFYFFVQGILGDARLGVGAAVGAFTASYLVGLLLVFTPGGLGAREAAIYALLAAPLGAAPAFVVMIGSRLLMTATEVLAALLTLPLPNLRSDVNQA